MDEFMQMAIEEAKLGLAEGGIPIGSVLVVDGKVVGRGHNRRVQRGSAILHAEMDCLENAGRLKPSDYRQSVALLDALALRHVQRHRPALPDPRDRDRREPHFPRPGRLHRFARHRARNRRQRRVHPVDAGFHQGEPATLERGHWGGVRTIEIWDTKS